MPEPDPSSPEDREAPAYGRRIPDELWEDFLAAERREEATRQEGTGDAPAARPRALRRMCGGLSFAACMLGLLLVFGLVAAGHPRWAVLGAVPLTAGAAGGIAVLWRLPRALRDQDGPRVPRRANRWFWLPAGMAVLGVSALVTSYLVPGMVHGSDVWVRNIVVLWAEIGFALVLMASMIAGLVALALWTAPDEDEAILRRTDYAERAREREAGRGSRGAGRPRGALYDSHWIRGGREDDGAGSWSAADPEPGGGPEPDGDPEPDEDGSGPAARP